MRSLRSLIPALAILVSGCHYYAPAEISTLPPQAKIVVQLDDAELTRLLAYSDPRTRTVSGRFVSEFGDSVQMVVRTPLAYRQVVIPKSSIIDLQLRHVDKRKSFLFSATAVGLVGTLAYLGFEGKGGSLAGGEGQGGDAALIPLFSFGLPFGH